MKPMITSAIAVAALCLGAFIGTANAGETTRANVATDGTEADGFSSSAVVSGNGRFVAFSSSSSNLGANDGGFFSHIYLRDLATGTTVVVDIAPDPAGLGGGSGKPSISPDGRYVAFSGNFENFDGNPSIFGGIFVRDMEQGTVALASVNDAGDLADGGSMQPTVSADGQKVAFSSSASNLVANDTNQANDIFLHDLAAGTTEMISVATSGEQSDGFSSLPSMSADGRFVAFTSAATNLVAGDTNGRDDAFLRDRTAGTTVRMFNVVDGRSPPAISADGAFVVSANSELDSEFEGEMIIYEVATGNISLAVSGLWLGADAQGPAIGGDGRFVVFEAGTPNFTGGTGIYLHDRETEETILIESDDDGILQAPSVSDNGEIVAFASDVSTFVANDTNNLSDIFVHDRETLPPANVVLVASVLPSSRSVQVGDTASAFATIINAGTEDATACAPGLPFGMSIPFSFQATDAATNAPIGTADAPVDIAAGQAQSFVFSLAPTVALAPTDIAMDFSCSNGGPVSTIVGVNTILFSASDQPVADVIVLAATLGEIPGVMDLDGVSGSGAFAIATFNVGAADTFSVAPRASNGLLVTLSICETNPGDGSCMQPPAAEVTTSIANGETPTFAVFATGTGTEIPLDAANSRISVDFTDSGDAIRGGSSVAIRTN